MKIISDKDFLARKKEISTDLPLPKSERRLQIDQKKNSRPPKKSDRIIF